MIDRNLEGYIDRHGAAGVENLPEHFLVGAAVGSGLAAIAAQRGGADFLLALNAGWLRVRGASSITSILPVADGNRAVLTLGRDEIIPQCDLPLYFGAHAYNLPNQWRDLVIEAKLQGFSGFVNFPTVINLPTELQDRFEQYGIGFSVELQLLRIAKSLGLDTLVYVRTKQQAITAAESGIDIICLNFGWNAGNADGATTNLTINDIIRQAHEVYRTIVRYHPNVKFLLGHGPIETAENLAQIYREVPVHGYIGGSTLDSLPTEQSISDHTRGFKSVKLLAGEMKQHEDDLIRKMRKLGLIGSSKAMIRTFGRMNEIADVGNAVFIQGEVGSGRGFAAEALHRMSHRKNELFTEILLAQLTGYEAGVRLFGIDGKRSEGKIKTPGLLEVLDGGTVYIEEIAKLPKRLQARLAKFLERGTFSPLDERRIIASDVRVICSSTHSTIALTSVGMIDPSLGSLLGNDILIPPLRSRLDDIPGLLRIFVAQLSGVPALDLILDASALGTLSAHKWPGNINEIRRLAARLVERAGQTVSAKEILSAIEESEFRPVKHLNEREWIAGALRRNRFRRKDTAADLGVSRKTLYNKIKKYGLT